jgi:hypothetical protein
MNRLPDTTARNLGVPGTGGFCLHLKGDGAGLRAVAGQHADAGDIPREDDGVRAAPVRLGSDEVLAGTGHLLRVRLRPVAHRHDDTTAGERLPPNAAPALPGAASPRATIIPGQRHVQVTTRPFAFCDVDLAPSKTTAPSLRETAELAIGGKREVLKVWLGPRWMSIGCRSSQTARL